MGYNRHLYKGVKYHNMCKKNLHMKEGEKMNKKITVALIILGIVLSLGIAGARMGGFGMMGGWNSPGMSSAFTPAFNGFGGMMGSGMMGYGQGYNTMMGGGMMGFSGIGCGAYWDGPTGITMRSLPAPHP